MSTEAANTDGLLVLRLWIEPGLGMRVRITRNSGHGPVPATTYAASTAEVLATVEQWIDDALADPKTDALGNPETDALADPETGESL